MCNYIRKWFNTHKNSMTWWLNCTHSTSAFATCLIISTGWKSWVDILELSKLHKYLISLCLWLSKWGFFSKILLIYFNNASIVSYLFLNIHYSSQKSKEKFSIQYVGYCEIDVRNSNFRFQNLFAPMSKPIFDPLELQIQ